VRRKAEQALHRAHDDLERLVAERTVQLARANESLHRSETYLAEAQRLSLTGSFGWNVSSGEIYCHKKRFEYLNTSRRLNSHWNSYSNELTRRTERSPDK